jgi:ribokinase
MVVVFGSINLDLVTRVERFPRPGETLVGLSFASYPGGKGANQALAAARAGVVVQLYGAVGRDSFAEPALALLRAGGVDLRGVVGVDTATGIAAITVSASGENCIAVISGANGMADPERVPDSSLRKDTLLLLQHEVPDGANRALIRRARDRAARVVLNAAPARPLGLDRLRELDFIVVNESEATALAREHGWPDSPEAFARTACTALPGICIVVTMGAAGALTISESKLIRVEAPAIEPIDTTGAGDAFAGALAAMLDEGASTADALRHAVAAGSLACAHSGAQPALPDRSAIDALARQLRIRL